MEMLDWIEPEFASGAAHANAIDGGRHDHWRDARGSTGDIERVDAMEVIGSFMGEGVDIESSRDGINDRRSGDTHFHSDIGIGSIAIAEILVRDDGGNAQIRPPEQAPIAAGIAVRIKAVDGIMFGADNEHIKDAATWNGDIGHEQRL